MTQPVWIPADVDREDRLVANLTARQVLILTVTGLLLYGAWTVTRPVLPTAVFLLLALPFGAAAAVVALGSRDGVSLDRLLVAAVRQRLQPSYRVVAPDGIGEAPAWLTHHTTELDHSTSGRVSPVPLRLPAQSVTDTGVVDLGEDGMAVVAVASTVNFALRTLAEQQAVVACLARYLHSLTAPVQILIRAERLGLSEQITALREHAASLPHPALEVAAREHADYLAQLAEGYDLLRRQVLLVLRESAHPGGPADPGGAAGGPGWSRWTRRASRAPAGQVSRRVAEVRLARRLTEATDLLAPAGVRVRALDPWQATAVLAAACNPDTLIPTAARLAASDDIITTTDPPDFDDRDDPATSPAASLADEDLAAGPDAGLATGLADADFAGGDPAGWDGFDHDESGRSW
jgi:hypothetical protein